MTNHWTLGVFIGLPVAGIFTLTALAAIALGIHIWRGDRYDADFEGPFVTGAGVVVLVATLTITALTMWPFDARFHQWRPMQGVVQQTNTRLIADGKSVSQRIVVRIDGKPYGCDDTRCALLQPGDRVALTCKPEFQYAGASGEGCEFVGSTRTGDMP